MAAQKPPDESITATATVDTTPRVGIVLSDFTGGEEHDGTKLAGLRDPCPVDTRLSEAQTGAMLAKAIELGSRRRGGLTGIVDSEDWLLLLSAKRIEPAMVSAMLAWLGEHGCGKRITVWGSARAEAVRRASVLRPTVRFELLGPGSCDRLRAPAPVRVYSAGNREGVYSLPRAFRSCDRVIAMAPLTVHRALGAELTAAAYLDLAPPDEVRAGGALEDVLADLFAHHPAEYAVAGGTQAYGADGQPVPCNLVIAGTRAVAVDAVASAVMGVEPKKVAFLDKLERRGFGTRDPDSIWTRGNEIEQAAASVRRSMERRGE